MAILNNNPLVGASGNQGGYNINNSLRLRKSASAYLSRTPASAGNRKTFTWSGWVKRGEISVSGTNDYALMCVRTNSSTYTLFSIRSANAGAAPSAIIFEDSASTAVLATSNKFRDTAAWYHFVLAVDTTQATASNRVKIYVNNQQVTSFDTYNTYPTLNSDMMYNTTNPHNIGRDPFDTAVQFDGYMTDINFIDGQALTPSSFGETDTITGVWKPKAYTGTYGTNGFYLKFSDIATTSGSNAGLGKDFSGNSNYWTTNNISVTSGTTYDAMTDSPTNTSATVANYCVLNPLIPVTTTTVTNGNLSLNAYNPGGSVFGTMGVSSGKWYFESISQSDAMSGISGTLNGGAFPGAPANAYTWDAKNAQKISNSTSASYGSAASNGDIIGVAFDLDTGSITFYKNGVSQGVAYTFTPSGNYFPVFRNGDPAGTPPGGNISVNFGQRPFAYTPPTGFVALNTFNLPTSTIVKGNSYFDSTLYTGTGATQSITNAGLFKPDLVWVKARNAAQWHLLFDSVRGVGNWLTSNNTIAEVTDATSLTAFNSNGFAVSTDPAVSADTGWNASGNTMVGWQWQAGQGSTSSNTSGSITSTVSVNTTAGFSIVTYTNSAGRAAHTVGHGLGVAPRMFIIKTRSATADWVVYHASLGATQALYLNQTLSAQTGSAFFNNTAPTSTIMTLGSGLSDAGTTIVAYCFAEIAGFSRFASYTGNGSTNGPFVYLGFRPKYLLIKCTSTAEQWAIKDTSLVPYNTNNTQFFANATDGETTDNTYHMTDFLSNGFKIRGAAQNLVNGNGQTYIYAAFAENPFKNALAR